MNEELALATRTRAEGGHVGTEAGATYAGTHCCQCSGKRQGRRLPRALGSAEESGLHPTARP